MPAMPTNAMTDPTKIVELEKQSLMQSYGRLPLIAERGEGCYLIDVDGKRYLDFVSGIGVNALGHRHPRILAAMHEQIDKLIHCSNLYYHSYQGLLAERLTKASGLQRAFFCNSGAEAVEGALKIAKGFGRRKSPDKHEIVALKGSFGGRTLGAIAVTGQPKYREPFEPLMPGVRFIDPNDLAALASAVNERTAAILFEPILGEGGIVEISADFARQAARLARANDALLIFDEIQTGLGRTGTFFAFEQWNCTAAQGSGIEPVEPDVLVTAKPLAAGLPLGCILANDRAAGVITPGMHGTTFGGNALACRVALEVVDVVEELLPSIRETGAYFHHKLGELLAKYDFVAEVRGKGLMRGLNLTVPGKSVVGQAQEAGVLINCTADTVLRFLPPYIIQPEQIDELVAVLDRIFEEGPPQS